MFKAALGAVLLLISPAFVAADADSPAVRSKDDCGAICLFIALRSLDVPVENLSELLDRIGPPPGGGYNLAQLAETAESYGVRTRGVETSTINLSRRSGRFACIAHYAEGHFVNLINVENDQVHLIDAPRSMRVPMETFNSVWSRNALLISHEPILAEEDLPIEWNWGRIVLMALAAVMTAAVFLIVPRFARKQVAGK